MVTYGVTESPFGGTKESGIGRVNGDLGLKGFCHTKSIVVDRLGGKSEPTWFPYTARKARTFKRVMRVVWGSSLGRLLS
jgi:succinate-semialdehyde dehydrogenase/glutarate-semialdehyde dehydrogenase